MKESVAGNVSTKKRMFRRVLFTLAAAGISGAGLAALLDRLDPEHTPLRGRIDRILVEKQARTLSVFRDGKKLRTYRIALGGNPTGPKEEEGDQKTPEGVYTIDFHKPDSDFHLALHVSYPSAADTERAGARGVSAGSDIMVHGLPNGMSWLGEWHRQADWTAGCIAVTDEEIEEIYRITPDGTTIEIRP